MAINVEIRSAAARVAYITVGYYGRSMSSSTHGVTGNKQEVVTATLSSHNLNHSFHRSMKRPRTHNAGKSKNRHDNGREIGSQIGSSTTVAIGKSSVKK